MRGQLAIALSVAALLLAAQQRTPLFENEQVRATRRVWGPHEVFMVKKPLAPALVVFVTDYRLRFTWAERAAEEHTGKAGDFYWTPGGISGVDNLEDRPAAMIRFDLKCSDLRPGNAVPLEPFRERFENSCVTVQRIRGASGERRAASKNAPAVLVPLSEMRLRVTHSDGRTEEIAGKAGDALPLTGDVYRTENLRNEPFEALRIEVRQ